MANEEHVRILKEEGVEAWNKWRIENPDVQPDLTQVNLTGVDITKANFTKANLTESYLSEANLFETYLTMANLHGANLYGAKLTNANLYGANLSEANLTIAILTNAKLTNAKLTNANLYKANLSKANLSMADLSKSHLSKADLSEANLSMADLSMADLSMADLSMADLSEANLASISLNGANLSAANLHAANLTGAHLWRATLIRANLNGAIMRSAGLFETIFGSTHMNDVEGIEECNHRGSSIIDIDTIRKSWPLPLSFLRGCGLDDTFIEYIPSLIGQPIRFYSCFISYSSKEEDFARRLHADLQNEGVRCWFAPEDMKIGDRIRYAIDDAIRLRDKLLLVLSETSIESNWVETEVETALEEERERGTTVLFPVRIDDAVMETKKPWARQIRTTRHIGDFSHWKDHDSYQTALERLLRDLKTDEA